MDDLLIDWLFASVGFSLNNIGYVVTGRLNLHGNETAITNSLLSFDPTAASGSQWTNLVNISADHESLFLGTPRSSAVAISINYKGQHKAYVGTSENGNEESEYSDFFEIQDL